MTIKQAIEKAIEGGFQPPVDNTSPFWYLDTNRGGVWFYDRDETGVFKVFEQIFLDPLFWQGLGKSLDWPEYCCPWCGALDTVLGQDGDVDLCEGCHSTIDGESQTKYWLFQQHRFIDHLSGIGTTESFFANLSH